jgi:hypothetical protein
MLMAIFYHLDRRGDCVSPGYVMALKRLTPTPDAAEVVANIHEQFPEGW